MKLVQWSVFCACLLCAFTVGATALPCHPRSSVVRHHFQKMTGYPHGRKGYVVDHIVPLACGGADAVSNMQWQTIADGKAKDKWERKLCPPCGK